MSKQTRNSAFYKQDYISNKALRLAKKIRWEEKYGKDNLSTHEQMLLDMENRKLKQSQKPKIEKPIFSPRAQAILWAKQNPDFII